MKTTAKIISVLLIAVMAIGMAGCNKTNKTVKPDIKELQQHKGDMLVITSYPQEAMPREQYEKGIKRMSVCYEGVAYNPNPVNNSGVKLPNDEYMMIYNFCVDAAAKERFKDYSEQVCDGETYKFTYYDTEGNEHVIYNGYCYANEELQNIMKMISKYSLD